MEQTTRPSITSALNVFDTLEEEKKSLNQPESPDNSPSLLDQTKAIKDVLKSALNEIEQSQKEFGRISGLLEAKLDKIVK